MSSTLNRKMNGIFCRDFRLGIKDSMPICLAFLFMCISFGGFAKTAEIPLSQTLVMAMLVYSIPLQVILVKMLSSGMSIATVALLSLIINGRFFLMSLSLIPHFNKKINKIVPALLMLSASSFTVSHVKLSIEKLNSPFKYYLGVASTAYVTTFLSTIIGFYIVFINNNVVMGNIFSIALGIHFTALTAMRWPKIKYVVSTFLGFLLLPALTYLISLDASFIITPIVTGLIMILIPEYNPKEKEVV